MKFLCFHGQRLTKFVQVVVAIAVTTLLISCGGGSDDNAVTPSALEVIIGAANTLSGGESDALTASINNASGEVAYNWDILSGQENGEIENGDASSATFHVFNVLEAGTTVIELSVTDSEGKHASVRHSITIELGGEQQNYLAKILSVEDSALRSCLLVSPARSVSELNSLNCENQDVEFIEGLSLFSGLTTINLSNNSISDLSELEAMPGIAHLVLDENPKIEEFAPIGNLENLQTLSISYRKKVLNFSFIEALLNLETLSINSVELEIDVDIESTKRQALMILRASCPN